MLAGLIRGMLIGVFKGLIMTYRWCAVSFSGAFLLVFIVSFVYSFSLPAEQGITCLIISLLLIGLFGWLTYFAIQSPTWPPKRK